MTFYEIQPDRTLVKLNLLGENQGPDAGGITPLVISKVGDPVPPTTPIAPVISAATMPSRTQSHVVWIAGDNSGFPPITQWVVSRRESTDGGTTFGAWSPIAGSPFAAGIRSIDESGLITGTPEVIFQYRVRADNADGAGTDSSYASLQWSGTPASPPQAPTGLGRSNLQPTSVQLNWSETLDPTVLDHSIWQGVSPGTMLQGGIDRLALSYVLNNLTPNTPYANLNVRRSNSVGTSPPSNVLPTFTTPQNQQTARFVGHVPGKIIYGFARLDGLKNSDVLGAGDPASIGATNNINLGGFEGGSSLIGAPYNARLGIRRIYSKDAAEMAAQYAQGVMWFLSAKADDLGASGPGPANWATIANGGTTIDNAIRNYFSSLVTLDRPLIFAFHHEPVGDAKPSNSGSAANSKQWALDWCQANRHIMDVFETEYGTNTKITFTCNIEGFTFASNVSNVGDLRNWFPDDLINRWSLITTDLYHNTTASPLFSTRMANVEKWFYGAYIQPGGGTASWLHYVPGVDIALGIGEHAGRYKYYDNGSSAVSAAKWARDSENYIFARPDVYPVVCWFNSIGIEDERLEVPRQAGDTERVMDVYREKLNSPLVTKITDIGL